MRLLSPIRQRGGIISFTAGSIAMILPAEIIFRSKETELILIIVFSCVSDFRKVLSVNCAIVH